MMAECNVLTIDVSVSKFGPYVLGRTVGAGGEGSVFLATHEETKMEVAVKVMEIKETKETNSREVSRRLMNFRHPHIIKLFETIITPPHIIEIMELPCLADLEFYTHKFEFGTNQARKFFQQIISAVDYCHRNRIVHRDIKLRNFLVGTNLNIKLIDFGEAAVMTDGNCLQEPYGSSFYIGPEMALKRLYIGPEADIWSCGICLYLLLTKGVLLNEWNQFDLSAETLNRPEYRKFFNNSSVIGLIQSMILLDEGQRATMEDIKSHRWFTQDLPDYLFPPPWSNKDKWIDINAIKEVHKKCEVSVDEVLTALKENDPSNKICLNYNLTVDNWNCDMLKTSPIGWECNIGPPRRIAELYEKELSANRGVIAEVFRFASCFHTARRTENQAIVHKKQRFTAKPVKKTTMVFYRGIQINDRIYPDAIMDALYGVLKNLNMEWKVENDFHLIARMREDRLGLNVKIALQLFRTFDCMYPFTICINSLPESDNASNPDEGYRKVMVFLEICSLLINETRIVFESVEFKSKAFSRQNRYYFEHIHYIKM